MNESFPPVTLPAAGAAPARLVARAMLIQSRLAHGSSRYFGKDIEDLSTVEHGVQMREHELQALIIRQQEQIDLLTKAMLTDRPASE